MANGDKGGMAVMFVVGGAVGAGLAAILAAKPVAAAPETDKLDYIAALLEELNKNQIALIAAINNLVLPPGGGGAGAIAGEVATPWVAKDKESIYATPIRSVGVFNSDKMVDYTRGKRMLIKVESSLDQPASIQLVGGIDNTFNLATNVGGPNVVPANGNLAIGLAWDDWHPYIGVVITVAAAPTTGILNIWGVIQE